MKRLGIMGGTFDPIHYAHLITAEEVRQAFALEKVIFVPNRRPPHKDRESLSSAEDRYAMTVLATESNSAFKCSRVELERSGLSYSIDTIRYFQQQYPDLEALYFITGVDALLFITTWHEWRSLLTECQMIGVTRPGFGIERLQEIPDEWAREQITSLRITGLEISSTNLRQRVREGRSIKYLTPEPVEQYIANAMLYQADRPDPEEDGEDQE